MKKNQPKWRVVERVVKLIEKTLSPDSRVEHNVLLPDLTSRVGSKRQCDVVIWSGKPPRETITIVEVQARGKKVDINTFHGWCEKMRKVGAQHLICVSAKGFPRSVKDEALKCGPTVRLVTLAELERNKWPISLAENYLEFVSIPEGKARFDRIVMLRLESGHLLRCEYRKKEVPFFQYPGQDTRLSLYDLIHMHVIEKDLREGSHHIDLTLPQTGRTLYYFEGNQRTPIRYLFIVGTVEVERGKIPLTFSSYTQSSDTELDVDQPLAWIMNATGVFRGEEIDIRAVFVPDQEGILRLSHVSDATGNRLFFGLVPGRRGAPKQYKISQ